MRTVDVLLAARDLFSNSSNWTSGQLVGINCDGTPCFCAIGGLMNAGGCYDKKLSRPQLKKDLSVSSTAGLIGVFTYDGGFQPVEQVSRAVLAKFEAQGVHAAATKNAIKYLGAAVVKLSSNKDLSIVGANDSAYDGYGYSFIMRALDLAITNAKRRHIKGDRQKFAQASA